MNNIMPYIKICTKESSIESEKIEKLLHAHKAEQNYADASKQLKQNLFVDYEASVNHKLNSNTVTSNFEKIAADITKQLEKYRFLEKAINTGSVKTLKQSDLSDSIANLSQPFSTLTNNQKQNGALGSKSNLAQQTSKASNTNYDEEQTQALHRQALEQIGQLEQIKKLGPLPANAAFEDMNALGRKPTRVIAADLAKRIELLRTNHGEYEMFYAKIAQYREEARLLQQNCEILNRNKRNAAKNTPDAKIERLNQKRKDSQMHMQQVRERHEALVEQKRNTTINELIRKYPTLEQDFFPISSTTAGESLAAESEHDIITEES